MTRVPWHLEEVSNKNSETLTITHRVRVGVRARAGVRPRDMFRKTTGADASAAGFTATI